MALIFSTLSILEVLINVLKDINNFGDENLKYIVFTVAETLTKSCF